MELKEMIKVMQHFADGGEVEFISKGGHSWDNATAPCWDWDKYAYQIKKQNQKVTIEKWLILGPGGDYSIFETSNIAKVYECEPIKLLETYEVEI